MSLVGPGRHYAPAFSRAMATLYGESELRASIRDPPGKPRSPLGEVAMLSHVAPKPVWLSLSAGFCCCVKRSWQPSPVSLGVRTSLEVRGVHSRVLVKAGSLPSPKTAQGPPEVPPFPWALPSPALPILGLEPPRHLPSSHSLSHLSSSFAGAPQLRTGSPGRVGTGDLSAPLSMPRGFCDAPVQGGARGAAGPLTCGASHLRRGKVCVGRAGWQTTPLVLPLGGRTEARSAGCAGGAVGIASPRWVPTAVTGRTAHRGPGSAPSPVTPPRPLSSAFESISQRQRPACGAGRRALPPASARPRRPPNRSAPRTHFHY